MKHTLKSHEVTGQLAIYTYKTSRHGLKSIYKKCIDSWNMKTSEINKTREKDLKIEFLKMYSRNELKTITKHFLSVYISFCYVLPLTKFYKRGCMFLVF